MILESLAQEDENSDDVFEFNPSAFAFKWVLHVYSLICASSLVLLRVCRRKTFLHPRSYFCWLSFSSPLSMQHFITSSTQTKAKATSLRKRMRFGTRQKRKQKASENAISVPPNLEDERLKCVGKKRRRGKVTRKRIDSNWERACPVLSFCILSNLSNRSTIFPLYSFPEALVDLSLRAIHAKFDGVTNSSLT